MGRWVRRCRQLLITLYKWQDTGKWKRKHYMHSVENSLWEKQWTCRKTGYRMYSSIYLVGLSKNHEKPVKIASTFTEISAISLPKGCLVCYNYTKLVSWITLEWHHLHSWLCSHATSQDIKHTELQIHAHMIRNGNQLSQGRITTSFTFSLEI